MFKVFSNALAEIFTMVGAHGLLAICFTLMLVRTIRVLWYMEGKVSFLTNLLVGAMMGITSAYFFLVDATTKQILGCGFATIGGSIIAFHVLKFSLHILYEKTELEGAKAMYFFLTPKPLKIKKNGTVIIVPPHSDLTQVFDKVRLDKKKKVEPDEHENGDDQTRVMAKEEHNKLTDRKR